MKKINLIFSIAYKKISKNAILYCKETGGLAATEFAIILPVLSVLWLGIVVTSEAFSANRKSTMFAHTIGEMIASSTSVTTQSLNNIYNTSIAILWPFTFNQISLSLVSIVTDNNKNQYMLWSRSFGSATTMNTTIHNKPNCYKIKSWTPDVITYEVPDNYIYVVTRIVYAPSISSVLANDLLGNFFTNGTNNLEHRFFVRPRYSTRVEFPGNQCTQNPF